MGELQDGDEVVYTPSWGSEWTATVELLDGVPTPGDVRCRLIARRDGAKSSDEGRVLLLPQHRLRLAEELMW